MPGDHKRYAEGPEALVVALARAGDRDAFAELVHRRQSWIRNMMRRFCNDATLADDLAQQVFLQAWRGIPKLKEPARFGAWLKRLAVNTWLQYLRANDVLNEADPFDDAAATDPPAGSAAMDLDRALATLPLAARTCIVLSYNEGMTHGEISEATRLPLGTVKSHIRRGTAQLQECLAAYKGGTR